jgi:hypothetical protein
MSEGRWELVDRNPHTGVEKWMDYDQETDSVLISTRQDKAIVQGAIDQNKAAQNESWDKRSDLWHAAHIPVEVQMDWLVKHGVDCANPHHWDGVKKLLNSNEYRYLRVRNFIL